MELNAPGEGHTALARDVEVAVRHLNDLLSAAHDEGLKVDLESLLLRAMGKRYFPAPAHAVVYEVAKATGQPKKRKRA